MSREGSVGPVPCCEMHVQSRRIFLSPVLPACGLGVQRHVQLCVHSVRGRLMANILLWGCAPANVQKKMRTCERNTYMSVCKFGRGQFFLVGPQFVRVASCAVVIPVKGGKRFRRGCEFECAVV